MKDKSKFITTIAISSLLAGTFPLSGGSYTVTIPASTQWPLGWHFQDKTVENAFPSPVEGTQLYFWDSVNQSWVINQFDFGEWIDPDYTITNGAAFYYRNNSGGDLTVTVSGTDLTVTNKSRSFVANKLYFISPMFLNATNSAGWMECVETNGVPRYTDKHLGFDFNNGDLAYTYDITADVLVGGVRKGTNCATAYLPFWESLTNSCTWAWSTDAPAQVRHGFGFWYKPSVNTTWTEYALEENCQ